MAINYTPLAANDPATASVFNSRLSELDKAIGKNNYTATSVPGTNDDSTDGYSAGSRWLDTASGKLYVCTSATPGAAVWQEFGLSAGSGWTTNITPSGSSITLSPGVSLYRLTGTNSTLIQTINGGSDGDIVYIVDTAGGSRFRHAVGNIFLPNGGFYHLNPGTSVAGFIKRGTNWHLFTGQHGFDGIVDQFNFTSTAYQTAWLTTIPRETIYNRHRLLRGQLWGRFFNSNLDYFSLSLLYGGTEFYVAEPSNGAVPSGEQCTWAVEFWLHTRSGASSSLGGVGVAHYQYQQVSNDVTYFTLAVNSEDNNNFIVRGKRTGGNFELWGGIIETVNISPGS